ncbi:hypothetical protein HDU88_008488 [Geranomyces variabilis]|nr:hypothetical protein HDU88_008488 [Geranomyces variabilis]
MENFKRERVAILGSAASTLCALEAKGKLSPLPSLVNEITATIVFGASAAASTSILVAKESTFCTDELEFLVVLEYIPRSQTSRRRR